MEVDCWHTGLLRCGEDVGLELKYFEVTTTCTCRLGEEDTLSERRCACQSVADDWLPDFQ